MLPTSHRAPIVPPPAATEGALAEVFDAFMATAGRMEVSYGQLQGEVAQLRRELEQRNAALAYSLVENQKMRVALHRILNSLPCGVLVIDKAGHISLINPEARRLTEAPGLSELELTALPARIQNVVNAAVAREEECEFALKSETGTRWLSIRKSTMQLGASQSEANAADQTILILRDVTSRKQADEQREASRNMLALGEMSAVLAHEIRNPLSSMELWTGLLAKQPAIEDEMKYCVENLQAGIRSLSATVNNVLQFHGRGTPNRVRLKLGTVLQNGLAFIRPLAEQAGIKVALDPGPGDIEVAADPNALQQVVLNLAINSFRHTPTGGSLAIAARRKEDDSAIAIVEFTDSGRGIAPEDISRIFDPGFSATGHTPGLGLTICRRIMQQHQGSIRVSSQGGKGSTFNLEIPIL
jgi:two-component system sensor histidine kinase FlrB